MMNQFVIWQMQGQRWLMTIDTSRYDFWHGFHRFVKVLA